MVRNKYIQFSVFLDYAIIDLLDSVFKRQVLACCSLILHDWRPFQSHPCHAIATGHGKSVSKSRNRIW